MDTNCKESVQDTPSEKPPFHTLWTIGHSTHSIEHFIKMLQSCHIQILADIRRHPGSNKYPQFNQDTLKKHLENNHIDYIYIYELTGRRKVLKDSTNTAWRNLSFRGYADYMETPDFLKGIQLLEEVASRYRCAIMCAEAVWWRCHRSMVSDYMKSIHWTVIHILNVNQTKEHPYTSAAKIDKGKLHYKNQ